MGPWIKRFLLDHLIEERNLSRNTQRSYRDTLALLMPYAATERNKPVDRLDVFDLSSEVLRGFLDHLEQSRRCSIRTRNQRLAALHAIARFIAETQSGAYRMVQPDKSSSFQTIQPERALLYG